MPPLHATAARATRADVYVKRPDDRAHDRDVFLRRRRDVVRRDGAPTVRTRGRQPGVVRLVHTPRAGTLGQAALRGARAPTRTPARPSTAGLCTRRRLPIPRAARGVEWLRESIPLALQAIAIACRSRCARSTRASASRKRPFACSNSSRVSASGVGRSAGAPTLCQYPHICTSTEWLIRKSSG